MNDQVQIKERSKTYDIKLAYHSDLMCQNYDAELKAIQESDGRVSFRTADGRKSFEFVSSDPDRVIAIARMMLSFAQVMKNDNKNTIDTSVKS